MITVRIPQEIRKYKEKVIFGLTARQLKATAASLALGGITYYIGNGRITTDILTWIIALEAIPILAVGFVNISGMSLDKFASIWFKLNFIHPRKRVFQSETAYREWELDADYISTPSGRREKRAYKKWKREASLERAALITEAEEKGDIYFDSMSAALMTVRPDPIKEKLDRALAKTDKGVVTNA